jgi:uncharacterized protein involved in type VI secretion and phage assembly
MVEALPRADAWSFTPGEPMTALHGVYSASVLENQDPEGRARVRVRVVGLPDPGDLWARVATLLAGPHRGTWFIPDKGDEVLVAFEGGDIRRPCVLGALWSANAPPPETADQASVVKTIRSRSGTTIRLFDDSANARIVVETPGGQRLILQDSPGSIQIEDANGNGMTLSPSGITITASATVSLSSSNIEINAGLVSVNAGMSRFSGVIQCDTLIANSVVSAN